MLNLCSPLEHWGSDQITSLKDYALTMSYAPREGNGLEPLFPVCEQTH
jgi:hypothetical protein